MNLAGFASIHRKGGDPYVQIPDPNFDRCRLPPGPRPSKSRALLMKYFRRWRGELDERLITSLIASELFSTPTTRRRATGRKEFRDEGFVRPSTGSCESSIGPVSMAGGSSPSSEACSPGGDKPAPLHTSPEFKENTKETTTRQGGAAVVSFKSSGRAGGGRGGRGQAGRMGQVPGASGRPS